MRAGVAAQQVPARGGGFLLAAIGAPGVGQEQEESVRVRVLGAGPAHALRHAQRLPVPPRRRIHLRSMHAPQALR